MSLEACPFCGKPFKRLKSHLPHCKMAPGSKSAKITNKPKEIQTTNFQQKNHMDKINKVNTDTELNHPTLHAKSPGKSKSKKVNKMSVDRGFLENTSFTPTSTTSKDPSSEPSNKDTLKPKPKWLAKKEEKMLKRAKLQTQTRNELTSVSQREECNSEAYKNTVTDTPLSEKEIANGGVETLRPTTCNASDSVQKTSDCQSKQSVPANTTVSEQIQNNAEEYSLSSRMKEQGVFVFQTKTCVWDHIKHGLYKRTYDSVTVLAPHVSAHKVCVNPSESVFKPLTGNDENATMQFPVFQTSVQRPVEDVHSSRLQSMSVMPYSPDMATGYGAKFFFSSHSEISSNEKLLMYQTSKPSPQTNGSRTELRLGDVRLNQLASWLAARTPKLPREAITMINKGWQWYYRKYIDVQKGGIGGIAMLIGGYCVLSYIWSYPHIKKKRWRKYH